MDKQQLLRIGRISSYNFPDGTARVTYDDKDGSTTPEIPFLAWEHWRPKIGDQVRWATSPTAPAGHHPRPLLV